MGILVPNLIACENDPDAYKRQIEESLNSFKQFESELFRRAEFGIKCRIERADSLLKRLEDLKIKMNEIGPSTTLYFPSKLIPPGESPVFKVLSDDFLKNANQQNDITENILDIEYEKLRLLKDEAQSIRFSEINERVTVDTFQLLDFKSKDRANLHALTRNTLPHGQNENETIDVEKSLSESSSTSTDYTEESEDLTDHELSDDNESPLQPELTSTLTKSSTIVPAPPRAPPAPPLPPSDQSISKIALNIEIEKPQTSGRANLLASIRKGTKLKRVKSSEKKKPTDSDLMSTLAAKLQTRRNKIVPLVSVIYVAFIY